MSGEWPLPATGCQFRYLRRTGRSVQHGAALLVLLMALLVGSGYSLLQYHSVNHVRANTDEEIALSLMAAKSALIAFAVNYADNYGHNTRGGTGRLPCPALARHSSPATNCGVNAIGYLPTVWTRDGKRMEIDHLERFLDEDFWYAVSADFRYNPSYNSLNSDSSHNLFQVDSDNEVIGVVIAPGDPLDGQSAARGSGVVSAYLEGENADGDGQFSTSQPGSNDRIILITRSDLVPLIEKRVLGFTRDWLREYRQQYGHYPYASLLGSETGDCVEGQMAGMLSMQRGNCASVSFGEFVSASVASGRSLNQTWFDRNDWRHLIYYRVDPACTAVTGGICDGDSAEDSRQFRVNGDIVDLILVSTGREIETVPAGGTQNRLLNPFDAIHYLDSAGLLSAGVELTTEKMSDLSNDQYLVLGE